MTQLLTKMKTSPMKVKCTAAFWVAACAAWLMVPAVSHAQVVLASWQNDTGDGCIDWPAFSANGYNASVAGITSTVTTNQYSDDLPIYPNIYSFAQNAVPGYAQSLQITESGYVANLTLNLTGPQQQAFATNNLLSFTFSVPAGTYSGGYSQIPQIILNCNGAWGYAAIPYSNTNLWSATGNTANDQLGTASFMPNYYFANGANPEQSQTVTLNYASLLPQITNNGPGYLQIIFYSNNGGGAPGSFYMNDVTLSQTPTQIFYTVDDFSTNGVGPENPTNDDWFATAYSYADGEIGNVWSEWFGNGGLGITFDPNVNVSGNTNANGAMALSFTWDAATDGYQQWLIWHGNGATYVPVPGGSGTVGIGYPQYTNFECDVMFDPSSAATTNANGVLGVIRLGIRGNGAFGQDWINGSYTTISDTNWHHINAALNGLNPDFANIADGLIGEDVTSSVGGGGLTGNQILYVDNIRFTGPAAVPVVPPPILGAPQKASPGLRIFAGSTVNTYDRELLYTVDQNQSWVDPGATFPVQYSFSLQDYNPNIEQTMVELMGGGTSPTSYGEYADYSGPTTFWMQLNPVGNGQVMASVQWKTNDPGANPNVTATVFTNSTAVGVWSLVFTGPTNGYVVAPGHVIVGSTSFTIADGTVATDFQDPVFVAFGLQPNTTAGEGAYEDWGMISVTGVVDGNEFEDFTKAGSDIAGNLTPSGEFNNSISALPGSTIIQTTNDAWWVNWSQPASGFTLASTTNLTSKIWINPGWYSGYSDTNAPRVMPLTTPFASKYWVLLPQDDLPTANGSQNQSPPAAGPSAPDAFFLLSTNVVSP